MFSRRARSASIRLLLFAFVATSAFGQRDRLQGPIQSNRRVPLPGHVRGQAQSSVDEGKADPGLILPAVTLVLRPSDAQQADLDQLLAEQQNPKSPNYHKWLTPQQYAQRFGATEDDVARITEWLRQQNLEVTSVAPARNSIQVRGTAQAVEHAFGTEIHRYTVNGRRHFANATNPTLPADLDVMVAAIEGLDDFRMEPRNLRGLTDVGPQYTSGGNHYLAPDDLAVIYNVKSLYDAGINGTGQTIVVAGQTQLDLSDVNAFRTRFGLPAANVQSMLVPGLPDPGVVSKDVPEANLDVQWAGAVARNARILYVYSGSVMQAVQYAIQQNLAPVISVSYGLCELASSQSSLRAYQTWARQANAQGITWVNAAGDDGATDCSGSSALSVDAPASTPEVTGVGGTTLTESGTTYWNAANGTNSGSALSYIPEAVWNDSNTLGSPASGGGGASTYFLKPSWQTGAGVPNNGSRNVPDVALAASPQTNGYLVINGGKLSVFGGTSAGTPAFAGILALLNQYISRAGQGTGVGNINPTLYSLAQTVPAIFHDITRGDNIITVTCTVMARNCVAGSYGYSAAAGYDQASGLGSVDAYGMVTSWTGAGANITQTAPAMSVTASVSTLNSGDNVTVTAILTGTNSAPAGSIAFKIASTLIGTVPLSASGSESTGSITVSGAYLSTGANTITAEYSGGDAYRAASASVAVTVAPPTSRTTINGVTNAASYRSAFAPGMLMSVFGSALAPAVWSASSVPLPAQLGGLSVTINGIPAPLLYASPSQLNIQIPYEVAIGQQATITVNNNGSVATSTFLAEAVAPGIFTDQNFAAVPGSSGAVGQILTLFITGGGALTVPVATGAAPAPGTPIANLPRTAESLFVTVGGINAPVLFAGIPEGLVGVVQVNYQIPNGVPPGLNPVAVLLGSTSSAPATLTIK